VKYDIFLKCFMISQYLISVVSALCSASFKRVIRSSALQRRFPYEMVLLINDVNILIQNLN